MNANCDPLNSVGYQHFKFFSGNPNWCLSFWPHPNTLPSIDKASVWADPVDILIIFSSDNLTTCFGSNYILIASPNPNWPCIFEPQPYTWYWSLRNIVWCPPHDTLIILIFDNDFINVGLNTIGIKWS